MSFFTNPNDADNQKTYPQSIKPKTRANVYPRSANFVNREYANGNIIQPRMVIRRYQRKAEIIVLKPSAQRQPIIYIVRKIPENC